MLVCSYAIPSLGQVDEFFEKMERASMFIASQPNVNIDIEYRLFSDATFNKLLEKRTGSFRKKGIHTAAVNGDFLILEDDRYSVTIVHSRKTIVVSKLDSLRSGVSIGEIDMDKFLEQVKGVELSNSSEELEVYKVTINSGIAQGGMAYWIGFEPVTGFMSLFRFGAASPLAQNAEGKPMNAMEMVLINKPSPIRDLPSTSDVIAWSSGLPETVGKYKDYKLINNANL